jgi:endonuclease/exonuclease/phosphatase family metal-dependent hydrolase
MQLISLNIWGGHIHQPLLEFISHYRDVDIFCFQEVYRHASRKISSDDRLVNLNIFTDLQTVLPDHQAFFRPVVDDVYGIGMMIKKTIDVLEEGDVIIHDNPSYSGLGPAHSRNLQWVLCRSNQQIYSICNVHGLWNGQGKTDTAARLAQSQRIKTFLNSIRTPKILCGDFNLRPDTESIRLLEADLQNLIKIHGIHSTRTRFYDKEEKYADYIFSSPEIIVNSFTVLVDEVSDHAPLLLDYGIA